MTDFYYTYYLWCYILTTIFAVYLNKNNKSHVLMSLILLLDVLAPIDTTHFYSSCILIEMCVFISAIILNTVSSKIIAFLSVQMIALHIIGATFHGEFCNSPYRYLPPITEYSEILSCILLSNPIINIIKRKMKCHLLKS